MIYTFVTHLSTVEIWIIRIVQLKYSFGYVLCNKIRVCLFPEEVDGSRTFVTLYIEITRFFMGKKRRKFTMKREINLSLNKYRDQMT